MTERYLGQLSNIYMEEVLLCLTYSVPGRGLHPERNSSMVRNVIGDYETTQKDPKHWLLQPKAFMSQLCAAFMQEVKHSQWQGQQGHWGGESPRTHHYINKTAKTAFCRPLLVKSVLQTHTHTHACMTCMFPPCLLIKKHSLLSELGMRDWIKCQTERSEPTHLTNVAYKGKSECGRFCFWSSWWENWLGHWGECICVCETENGRRREWHKIRMWERKEIKSYMRREDLGRRAINSSRRVDKEIQRSTKMLA